MSEPQDPLAASLKALQAQFAAFQDGLGDVRSDVKDVLSQIHALRTAQSNAGRSIAELERVIGTTGPLTERTLVQSVAAIEALLAHRESSLADLPEQPSPSLQSIQSTFPPSQSPTSELTTSPPSPAQGKEYVDVSIQAWTPLSPSSLSTPHEHTPRLTTVDWNVDLATHDRFGTNSIRPTAFTPEYLARFLRDAHLPGGDDRHQLHNLTTSGTQLPGCRTSTSAVSSHPRQPNSESQQAHFTIIPTNFSSSDMSAIPSTSDTTPVAETSPRISEPLQPPSLTPHSADSSIAPFQTRPVGDLQLSPTSPLSSMSSTRDTRTPPFPANILVQSPEWRQAAPLTTEASMTSLQKGLSGVSQTPLASPLSSLSGTRDTPMSMSRGPQTSPADDGGLPSGLPTPPSETDDRESRAVSYVTRERGAAVNSKHVAVTPPLLTPEPMMAEDWGVSSATGGPGMRVAISEPPMPLTPPSFSPSSAVGSSFAEEGDSGGHAADKTAESSSQTGQAASTFATSTNESQSMAASNEHPSRVPDVDPSRSPRPPASQLNTELAEHRASDIVNGVGSPYFPINAYSSGYDFHFSSPLRRVSPPPPSTTSRHVTPSESSDARPTQDEDEVWHVLMPGESSVSTPLSGTTSLPMMFSHVPSRASSVHPPSLPESQSLAVDPSMLQLRGPALLPAGPIPTPEKRKTGSPRVSEGSLSSLTSLTDTEVDKESDRADTAHTSKTPHPCAPALAPADTSNPTPRHMQPSYRGRHSELYRMPLLSASRTRVASERAVSEATGMDRRAGGRGASLAELAELARKPKSRILLKVPEGKRGVKRKRSVDADEDEAGDDGVAGSVGMESEDGGTDGERGLSGYSGGMRVEEQQVGRGNGDVPPAQIGAETSIPGTHASMLTVSRLALESPAISGVVDMTLRHSDMPSDLLASRKATKKESERRYKKRKRVVNTNARSNVTYHVRNGQIVALAVEPEPEHQSRPPAPPSASQPGEAQAPTRVSNRKRRENRHRTMDMLPSFPTKEVLSMTPKRAEKWPELPSAFSNWDAQFIQCDRCDKWYHYGCVAIKTGDPRLEPAASFVCQICHPSAKRKTIQNPGNTCARPDCPEPHVTAGSELYFVEKLVGRKKIEGYMYLWLAKWEGYPMTEATWIPKENVVGGESKLFDAFLEDATEQGVDFSQDVVLLQEALDAGWKA